MKDDAEDFYLYKSIAGLKLNQSTQNPITYLNPIEQLTKEELSRIIKFYFGKN